MRLGLTISVDIELLDDIVRRAQTSPEALSRRALFNAYEEVLEEQGRGPEDDGVLYKFLHRMQRDERDDEGLEERFQRVLGELGWSGINEDGELRDATSDLGDATRAERADAFGRGRERSGSFDSFFDGSADKIAGPTDAAQDAQLRDTDRWKQRRSLSDTEAHSYASAQLPLRSKVNGYAHPPASQPQPGDYDAYDSDHTAPTANITDEINNSNVQIPGVNAPIPDSHPRHAQVQSYVPEPFRPSDTRLMDDAETFEQQRLHSLARGYLQIWRNRLRERNEKDEEMNRVALTFDRTKLLRAALECLGTQAQYRRNDEETERFFGRLERRAEKARSLFLLTKAFTHWAQSAEDEVQRTSVARRHILRTKFFNGWRDITVVNELKVQHFVLGRFLEKWRRRTAEIRDRQEIALEIYDDKVLRKYYKHWFFRFCNIAAPAWHNVRLKRVTFEKWHEIATILKDREHWAVDRREREAVRRTLDVWKQRTIATQAFQRQADEFRRKAMLKMALFSIQRQAQFAPLLVHFRSNVDTRLVRSIFQTWNQKAQLSRQAKYVDQMRILRNAWTAWNDRLRIKALEERVNDRVLVEALYKWTLASRVSLFQRVHDRNLKQNVFLTWITRANERRNTLDNAERRFALFKRTQRLRLCLRKIESATAEKRAEEFAITAEYEQKLKQRVFDQLLAKHEHFQQLNRWAGDARFYVLAKGVLKKWGEATQQSRRNRRRELYGTMRRTVKLNLVRRAFGTWREKANRMMEQQQQAEQMVHARTLENCRILLTHWNGRFSTSRELDAQATQRYDSQLQTRSLDVWAQRLQSLQTMDAQALALRQESTEIAAASAFKKLGWRLWNVQRQEENATALHQRNFEKHVRAMLRFWHEQTVERAAQRPVSPTPTGRSRRTRDDDESDDGGDERDEDVDNAGDETRGLEAWTAFDEDALGLSNLSLSLSISPQQAPSPPQSSTRPLTSSLRRPQTYPQPQSALRPRPPPIPEDMAFDDPNAFWTSTPMPPQASNPPPPLSQAQQHDTSLYAPLTTGKPGYLKTPSKRSVVRSKRPELPLPAVGFGSPEKRVLGTDRGAGVMSAPPVPISRDIIGARAGVTSFERRLQMGGFKKGVGSREKGRGRVGFGDVSHFGE
jgi:protein SFI1